MFRKKHTLGQDPTSQEKHIFELWFKVRETEVRETKFELVPTANGHMPWCKGLREGDKRNHKISNTSIHPHLPDFESPVLGSGTSAVVGTRGTQKALDFHLFLKHAAQPVWTPQDWALRLGHILREGRV